MKSEIILSESYEFHVVIKKDGDSFAGHLQLSPSNIKLRVMGESSNERDFTIGWENQNIITCHCYNKQFVLINLKINSAMNRVITRHPSVVVYHEIIYDIDFLISSESIIKVNDLYSCIHIHSNTINKWIGNTVKQQQLIEHHYKMMSGGSKDIISPLELSTEIDGMGELLVGYNFSLHMISSNFSAGINFPPSLGVNLYEKTNYQGIYELYNQLYDLMSFLIGDEVSVQKITIEKDKSFGSRETYIYYPTEKSATQRYKTVILFPLGHNLRHDTLGLPPVPLSLFNSFFNSDRKTYINKYIKYRRMLSSEERFLGFFRLLESICYIEKEYLDSNLLSETLTKSKPVLFKIFENKKSVNELLNRIKVVNKSKYNTEKCIRDFLKKLPTEMTSKWKYSYSEISAICKLRNDITHANEHSINDDNLLEIEKFTEVLLVISLLLNLGVNKEHINIIIDRLSGYHLIKKENYILTRQPS
ncbi:HEPN domain-containing protein [Serratia quinivorans]|uniref:ApeA N-terminal domain 1-containing protein n=1 Tax=Serratia quinivorans TaxID=137545 RepID=UPI0021792532|nr:HEPN domain-containing protein [Serratia quinivorans]CAI0845272.1 Uncharacterised protein [Serratia quinivorans]CAI2141088.1 Uncharacterised protein [Serratia quinivorans]